MKKNYSHEISPLAKAASDAGALSIAYTVVRLNGAIGQIFTDWIHKAIPERAVKVLHQIEECHGGTLNDSQWCQRMRGQGEFAEMINAQIALARRKFFSSKKDPALNISLYEQFMGANCNYFPENHRVTNCLLGVLQNCYRKIAFNRQKCRYIQNFH